MNLNEGEWNELISLQQTADFKQRVQYKGQKLKPCLTRIPPNLEDTRVPFIMPDTINFHTSMKKRKEWKEYKSIWEELEDEMSIQMKNYAVVCTNAEVEYKGCKFLLMEWPPHKIGGIGCYVEFMSRRDVRTFVNTCDIVYSERETFLLHANFINIVGIHFSEARVPSEKKIEQWLSLCRMYKEIPGCAIAVHCLDGIGRSPFLVVLSLIELGMENKEAITYLRSIRTGAISSQQETFLLSYQPRDSNSKTVFPFIPSMDCCNIF